VKSLRASSLPLYMKCGASLRGDLNISEWFPESVLGTAAHDAAARMVRGEPVDLDAIASLYGVEQGDLGPLYVGASKLWNDWGPKGRDHQLKVEIPLSTAVDAVEVTGQADVITYYPGLEAVEVIDWKSGRRDADHRDQVLAYCALALEAYPGAQVAIGKVCWLRTLEVEAVSMSRWDLPSWRDRLRMQFRNEAFQPGTHCQYCPRKHSCPGREEMQRGALAVLTGSRNLVRDLPPERQLAVYRRAKELTSIAYDVINQIKAMVAESGPIEADGMKLELVEEHRRSVKALEAWPVLQKYLSDHDLAESVTISVNAIEDAAGKGQPRGQAGTRRRAMFQELEAAGAIGTTATKKLVERRKRHDPV
jgi:hypothetical protein